MNNSFLNIKILSFNIFNNSSKNLNQFNNYLKEIKPDIICTQEDNCKNVFTNYKLLIKCGSFNSCETVAVYYNKNKYKDHDFTNIKKLYTTNNKLNVSRRNCIIFTIRGITIANIHLEGGRYIDNEILIDNNFDNYLNYKLQLLNDVISERPNIICGDFNSVYSENLILYTSFLSKQFKYFDNILKNRKFGINDKIKVKNWNNKVFELLLKDNYIYQSPENEKTCFTSSRGKTIVDCFWINNLLNKKIEKHCKIINLGEINKNMLFGNISDHNPVYLELTF